MEKSHNRDLIQSPAQDSHQRHNIIVHTKNKKYAAFYIIKMPFL
jgi:hypothetical protein